MNGGLYFCLITSKSDYETSKRLWKRANNNPSINRIVLKQACERASHNDPLMMMMVVVVMVTSRLLPVIIVVVVTVTVLLTVRHSGPKC